MFCDVRRPLTVRMSCHTANILVIFLVEELLRDLYSTGVTALFYVQLQPPAARPSSAPIVKVKQQAAILKSEVNAQECLTITTTAARRTLL